MRAMVPVNAIRRAGVIAAAAVVVPVVALAVGSCGNPAAVRAGTAGGGRTNGLQYQTPSQVIRDAIAALRSVRSVQIVRTPPLATGKPFKLAAVQVQGDAVIDIFEKHGQLIEQAFVDKDEYILANRQALRQARMPDLLAGRWVKVDGVSGIPGDFGKLALAADASILAHHGPLAPTVRQAMLNGRKVVVITDRKNGSKLYVANTGRPYPLLLTRPNGHRLEWTGYGASFDLPTPANTATGPLPVPGRLPGGIS